MKEKEASRDFWMIGKYKGETFVGRYLAEKGSNELSAVLASGILITIPKKKALGIKKLKIDGAPSLSKITATLQNKKKKSDVEQSIENLLNHINSY